MYTYDKLIKELKELNTYGIDLNTISNDSCIEYLDHSTLDMGLLSYKNGKLTIDFSIYNVDGLESEIIEEQNFYCVIDPLSWKKEVALNEEDQKKFESILTRKDLNNFSCRTMLGIDFSIECDDLRYDGDWISGQVSDEEFMNLFTLYAICYDSIRKSID